MKNELIKIINFRLKNINETIDELNRLTKRINSVNEKLDYLKDKIELFEDDKKEYSIYNFTELEHDDFNKILLELDNDVMTKLSTNTCNYEGLIYLIKGINEGISLSLTVEQKDAIKYFIEKMLSKKEEYVKEVENLEAEKNNLDISDANSLEEMYSRYNSIVDKLEDNEYVDDVDDILDAINYNNTDSDMKVDIFAFLLRYNADIYKSHANDYKVKNTDVKIETEEPETNLEINTEVEYDSKDKNIDLSKESNNDEDIENVDDFSNENELPFANYNGIDDEKEDASLEKNEEEVTEASTQNNNETFENLDTQENSQDIIHEQEVEEQSTFPTYPVENNDIVLPNEVPVENNDVVMPDFNSVLSTNYNEENVNNIEESKVEVNTAVEDVKSFLIEMGYIYDDISDKYKDQLLNSNIENCRDIVQLLKDNGMYSSLVLNHEAFLEVICNSNKDIINDVETIIENNFVSAEHPKWELVNDFIGTIPTVLIKEPVGTYESFVQNVNFYKTIGLDLHKVYQQCKELLVANKELISKNYEITKKYELPVDIGNCKYYLLLNNLENRINYYIEAVVTDSHGKSFDGMDFIKTYPAKLSCVTDLTIKRLQFAALNKKKVFGNKEKSLAPEITNLKLDILNIPTDYMNNYFNNEYDNISLEEKTNYINIINSTLDGEMTLDENLTKLENYREGIRYNINNIYVSRTKVISIYNKLVANNIDKNKALLFAICYNSVITKEEYAKIKQILASLGGM